MYKVHLHSLESENHSDEGNAKDHESEDCLSTGRHKGDIYSWSLYCKIGRKTHVIWQFHKFSEDLIQ